MKACICCGALTSGSIGAAGLRWPNVCQPCKDVADSALRAQCIAVARITQELIAARRALS